MIPKITKPNHLLNNNKKKLISLKKKKHAISKRIEDVLKLNIDGSEKKLINFSKSTDFHKKNEKSDDSSIVSNPLLLSTSIKRVQRFLPNINILLNTESNFNYNPTRQEHIKFEEKIKKEISFYTKEENDLREALTNIEQKLLLLDSKIIDSKIEIQALKSVSVSDTKSPLRKAIAKKLEDELSKEENQLNKKINSPIRFNTPKKVMKMSNRPIYNTDFTAKFTLKLIEEDKANKEKEKNILSNIGTISKQKDDIHTKLNELNEELKIVHNNRKVLIDQLYKHYLSLLKEGKDSRKEGLAWIIMEIFYLNKKILFSNFPNYLDNDCIHYLFKMANLNIKIIQLESKVKNKKDYLNKYIKNSNNNSFMNYFYDDSEENQNNYEYNKKRLSSLISTFSTKFNTTNSLLLKENGNKEKLLLMEDNNSPLYNKDYSIFKTTKTSPSNNNENLDEYIYKNSKKKKYKINEFEKYFELSNKPNNNIYRGNDTLKSDEYQTYFNLSNNLFELKQEKDKLKLNEMDRIFKEFQKNNYKQRYQVEKKVVISALIGEDNLETEMFKQSKREKEYIHNMNKIQLFQNKFKRKKSYQ
jgi:hypothetical protein